MSDLSQQNKLSVQSNQVINPSKPAKRTSFTAKLIKGVKGFGEKMGEAMGDEPPELANSYVNERGELTDQKPSARGR